MTLSEPQLHAIDLRNKTLQHRGAGVYSDGIQYECTNNTHVPQMCSVLNTKCEVLTFLWKSEESKIRQIYVAPLSFH